MSVGLLQLFESTLNNAAIIMKNMDSADLMAALKLSMDLHSGIIDLLNARWPNAVHSTTSSLTAPNNQNENTQQQHQHQRISTVSTTTQSSPPPPVYQETLTPSVGSNQNNNNNNNSNSVVLTASLPTLSANLGVSSSDLAKVFASLASTIQKGNSNAAAIITHNHKGGITSATIGNLPSTITLPLVTTSSSSASHDSHSTHVKSTNVGVVNISTSTSNTNNNHNNNNNNIESPQHSHQQHCVSSPNLRGLQTTLSNIRGAILGDEMIKNEIARRIRKRKNEALVKSSKFSREDCDLMTSICDNGGGGGVGDGDDEEIDSVTSDGGPTHAITDIPSSSSMLSDNNITTITTSTTNNNCGLWHVPAILLSSPMETLAPASVTEILRLTKMGVGLPSLPKHCLSLHMNWSSSQLTQYIIATWPAVLKAKRRHNSFTFMAGDPGSSLMPLSHYTVREMKREFDQFNATEGLQQQQQQQFKLLSSSTTNNTCFLYIRPNQELRLYELPTNVKVHVPPTSTPTLMSSSSTTTTVPPHSLSSAVVVNNNTSSEPSSSTTPTTVLLLTPQRNTVEHNVKSSSSTTTTNHNGTNVSGMGGTGTGSGGGSTTGCKTTSAIRCTSCDISFNDHLSFVEHIQQVHVYSEMERDQNLAANARSQLPSNKRSNLKSARAIAPKPTTTSTIQQQQANYETSTSCLDNIILSQSHQNHSVNNSNSHSHTSTTNRSHRSHLNHHHHQKDTTNSANSSLSHNNNIPVAPLGLTSQQANHPTVLTIKEETEDPYIINCTSGGGGGSSSSSSKTINSSIPLPLPPHSTSTNAVVVVTGSPSSTSSLTSSTLPNHLKSVFPEDSILTQCNFLCTNCCVSFGQIDDFLKHLLLSTCRESFGQTLTTVENVLGRVCFECKQCFTWKKNESELREHIERCCTLSSSDSTHSDVDRLCPVCNKSFFNLQSFSLHLRRKHESFYCEKCGLLENEREVFMKHCKNCSGEGDVCS